MEYARYIGTANVRVISKRDWETIGIVDQPQTVWHSRNSWLIPRDQFSGDAWRYLEKDNGFVYMGDAPGLDVQADVTGLGFRPNITRDGAEHSKSVPVDGADPGVPVKKD